MQKLKYTVGSLAVLGLMASIAAGSANSADFGPSNPFYAASTLPFGAPPFDKIKDGDYQPAIEAGMAQQLAEIDKIANDPAAPTFENTLVAMERSGRLLARASAAFNGVSQANTNPVLQKAKTALAPQIAAHTDAIRLNKKLFERIAAIYARRASLKLDAESLRLVERQYDEFVHSGANLSDKDKGQLKALNKELSSLSDAFSKKLLEATKTGAYATRDKSALAGLSDSQLAAAAQAAKGRGDTGYLIPLQNTTQQPVLASLSVRATREAIFGNSWNRAERGDANDTRDIHRPHRAIARAARAAARLCQPRRLETRRPDGQDPAGGPAIHGRVGAGRDREGGQRSEGHSSRDRRAEGRLHAAAVGLGLLRRPGAQGEIRSR